MFLHWEKVCQTDLPLQLKSHLWVNWLTHCLRREQKSESKKAKMHWILNREWGFVCRCNKGSSWTVKDNMVSGRRRRNLGVWYNNKHNVLLKPKPTILSSPTPPCLPPYLNSMKLSCRYCHSLHLWIHSFTHSAEGYSLNFYNVPGHPKVHGQTWYHKG